MFCFFYVYAVTWSVRVNKHCQFNQLMLFTWQQQSLIFGTKMKTILKSFSIMFFALPTLALANNGTQTTTVEKVQAATGATTAQVEVKNDSTTVISPRTGIRYTLGNTGGRPIVLKTAAVVAATPATANRIVASNPALSASSQEKAKQDLLDPNKLN